ncbi:MAG: hypothetical protein QOH87_2367, partial [Trebonia sp.]|nr:hypothetical protein [Trebonia sp.]
MHVTVLEFSQTVLEPLEVPHHHREAGGVVQGGEELQRVPQLLAALAQVMQGLGGRVAGDRRAAPGDLGEGHPGSLRGKQAGGPPCGCMDLSGTSSADSGRHPVTLLNFVQPCAPFLSEPGEPRRAQATGEGAELLAPPLLQVDAERLKVVRLRRGETARSLLEVEQVHVKVPGRRRQVADPLELGGEERELLGGKAERVAEELQRAARPPHADPQVVQELRVGVFERAVHVRLDRVEQAQQDGHRRLSGGHFRGDCGVHLVRVIARTAADGAQRVGERRRGGRPDAGDGGDQPGRPARRTRVTADLGDRQPRRERGRPRVGHARPLDEQPGHGLVVLVQQPVPGGRGAGGDDGNERAGPDNAGDAGANRAARQGGEHMGTGRLPARDQLRRGLARVRARTGQPKLAAAAPRDVL